MNTFIEIALNIFNSIYGEENVDKQKNSIVIHFPEITIENDYKSKRILRDIFAKITMYEDGTISKELLLKRSTFTELELLNGYIHSHIPQVYNKNELCDWRKFCLGRGSFSDLMAVLSTANYNKDNQEDIEKFKLNMHLLCIELKRTLEIESNKGIPYISIDKISKKSKRRADFKINNKDIYLKDVLLDDFIGYIINKKPFEFNFVNNIGIAQSEVELVYNLGTMFIDFCKEENINNIDEYINIYTVNKRRVFKGNTNAMLSTYTGKHLKILTFKDKPVLLNILHIKENTENWFIGLNEECFSYIIIKLLKLINYGFYARSPYEEDKQLKIL